MRAELAILLALLLGACGSAPKPADPPRLRAALEAESEGARRYARGDYAGAARRFADAEKLHAAIDDDAGVARNRLHLARTELATGRNAAALALLDQTDPRGDGELAIDIPMLRAQAQLGLASTAEARHSLDAATAACAASCPQAASLNLLQARAALGEGRAADALAQADAALKRLQDKDEAAETGNAWRIIAAARHALGDLAGGLAAARAALEIDRRLALPEKIARDWLLVGDLARSALAGKPCAPALAPCAEAAAAYRKALGVADAAGLEAISMLAKDALHAMGIQKKHSFRLPHSA